MKYFIYLGFAICFEVFGSTMLKMSEGFTLIWPSLGVIVGFLISFICLGLSLNGLALSNAYAIWAGLGTAFTAIVGVMIFHEEMNLLKVLAILFIVVGVIVLNKSQGKTEDKQVQYV